MTTRPTTSLSRPRPKGLGDAGYLYSGTVVHDRRGDHPHRLTHDVTMVLVDVDRIEELCAGHRAWSTHRHTPIKLSRADALGDPTVPLGDAVREVVHEKEGVRPTGPIAMLATPRTFGWSFNPIACYFCFDASGDAVEWLVLEVTNTPWSERHIYVVGPPGTHTFAKEFHVSPFLPMDLTYTVRYAQPDRRVVLSIDVASDAGTVLRASMALTREEPTSRAMGRLVRRPWRSAPGISAAIYANALALVARRAPYFRHPHVTEIST